MGTKWPLKLSFFFFFFLLSASPAFLREGVMLGLRNFGCKLNSQIEEGPRCFEPHHLTPRGSMDPFEGFFGPYAVGILPNWSRYVVARLSECPTGGAAIELVIVAPSNSQKWNYE